MVKRAILLQVLVGGGSFLFGSLGLDVRSTISVVPLVGEFEIDFVGELDVCVDVVSSVCMVLKGQYSSGWDPGGSCEY